VAQQCIAGRPFHAEGVRLLDTLHEFHILVEYVVVTREALVDLYGMNPPSELREQFIDRVAYGFDIAYLPHAQPSIVHVDSVGRGVIAETVLDSNPLKPTYATAANADPTAWRWPSLANVLV